MEYLLIHFPVANIETFVFIPPVVAFLISFFTSMAGISGAFLLLPIQVSLLGFTSLSVSSTNFLYNVVGTPGGILGYAREKRLVWPLAAAIITGTVPGVLVGYFLRVKLLPDPRTFKLFVGIVLLHVGYRLVENIFQDKGQVKPLSKSHYQTCNISATIRTVRFTFRGEEICFNVPSVFFPALCVGIISGVYGIGGGAILAPFLVTIIRLPVYAVAGAVLLANFITSVAGVVFYSTIPLHQGSAAPPDWLLGISFGFGGLLGMSCGAKWQRYLPERGIKLILVATVFAVSAKYIWQYVSHLL